MPAGGALVVPGLAGGRRRDCNPRGGSVGKNSIPVVRSIADARARDETQRIVCRMSDDIRFERWLNRNGRPDAYARWRCADTTRASELAFVAIASDARILMRLHPGMANSLALQAEEAALNMPSSKSLSELSVVAARVVAARIQDWRRYVATGMKPPTDHNHDPRQASMEKAADELALPKDILQQAQTDFPNARLSAGPTLLDTALRLGARGLIQLGAPMDAVLALGASRAAARRVRGHLRSMDLPLERCPEAIGILQEWCALTGKNPFLVPYGSAGGTISDRVKGFALDAATCVAVAAKSPGGSASPGFDALETAEEFHAYGILCVNADLVWNMDLDNAQHYASAAARLATAAMADPAVRLPEFPDYCQVAAPKLVLALARAACSSGIKARVSAGA
jgi:hypothetical protein